MVERILRPLAPPAYALLRAAAGLMFSAHGFQKIFGLLTDHQPGFGTQLWFGGVIELCAGLLIALGLFTAEAAFLASGTMAVAYVQFHWKLELGERLFPVVNKGELALLYSVVFLYLAAAGAGPLSLDRLLRKRK